MKSKRLTPAEHAMRSQPCTRCGAEPGKPCTSKSGRTTYYDHSERFYAARRSGALPVGEEE